MQIKVLASGSTGNCYVVEDGQIKILLEVGISWKRIQKALNFKTHEVVGALLSHGHGDHAMYAKDAMKAGIDVYCSQETADIAKLEGHRLNIIRPHEKIGPWTVVPFEAVHDVPTLGFLIASGVERLLYLTDSAYSKCRFSGLTHIMIEANYCPDVLSGNIADGSLPRFVAHRTRRGHMSIDTVVELLKANDLSRCRQIWLLHMSSGNSDEAKMIRAVQSATGVPTYAAQT